MIDETNDHAAMKCNTIINHTTHTLNIATDVLGRILLKVDLVCIGESHIGNDDSLANQPQRIDLAEELPVHTLTNGAQEFDAIADKLFDRTKARQASQC
jgi:hypothetical protein